MIKYVFTVTSCYKQTDDIIQEIPLHPHWIQHQTHTFLPLTGDKISKSLKWWMFPDAFPENALAYGHSGGPH